jgi:ABC-type multidrug transport system ATPase subunit
MPEPPLLERPPFLEMDDGRRGRLRVGSGETVVLLGPSGAGKTGLIRSLLGLDRAQPPARLRVKGRRAAPADVAALTGWVPEGDGVFLSDTVWDNVARPAGATATVADPVAARDALDLVGLGGGVHRPVSVLSAWERRRVALARALACRRPLLLIDGELDPTVWAVLPALLAQAPWVKATVLATATASERAWASDSVALVADGRIVAQGPLAALVDSRDPDVRGVLVWVVPS